MVLQSFDSCERYQDDCKQPNQKTTISLPVHSKAPNSMDLVEPLGLSYCDTLVGTYIGNQHGGTDISYYQVLVNMSPYLPATID